MKILITSGPTRQYLDPVRFLSNASSGMMGRELAQAALEGGHEVVVVSGPVKVDYPPQARVHWVETTEEMLAASLQEFPGCDGLIGAAAPCDYRPVEVANHKLRKTGEPLVLKLVETSDIVASVGQTKTPRQWTLGFALETEDARFRALAKLQKKSCDAVVINAPSAIDSERNSIEIVSRSGEVVLHCDGTKAEVARAIIGFIEANLAK